MNAQELAKTEVDFENKDLFVFLRKKKKGCIVGRDGIELNCGMHLQKHMKTEHRKACLPWTLGGGAVMQQGPKERSQEAAGQVNSAGSLHRRTFGNCVTDVATWDRSCFENYHVRKYCALKKCPKSASYLE